jgi:alcohol/geraniol dehydrogenase (NADP+)
MIVKGYAATEPGGSLKSFEYELGPLGASQVDIRVEYCGICHSDLSMLNNEWGFSQYPFVPGHEVVGMVGAIGPQVKGISIGQRVGLGWYSGSCMTCEWCMSGNHNLCPFAEGTIVGRYGGFADWVRADATWVVPLPDKLEAQAAGPLFCGGITVFNPIVQFNVKPTDRVGVIGIGGLGHLALRFLDAWGCEVTAFSNSPEKEEEAKQLGADHFVNSRDSQAVGKIANSFDFILSTVNASLDWNVYIAALRPKGRLHIVGVVPEPVSLPIFPLLVGQKSVSASPCGSPSVIVTMLEFAARHGIQPTIETYPFSELNDAMEKLRHGKPRYRIVLKH